MHSGSNFVTITLYYGISLRSQVHGYEFLQSLALLQIETRKRGEGGQRWFDFGPDAAPTDIV